LKLIFLSLTSRQFNNKVWQRRIFSLPGFSFQSSEMKRFMTHVIAKCDIIKNELCFESCFYFFYFLLHFSSSPILFLRLFWTFFMVLNLFTTQTDYFRWECNEIRINRFNLLSFRPSKLNSRSILERNLSLLQPFGTYVVQKVKVDEGGMRMESNFPLWFIRHFPKADYFSSSCIVDEIVYIWFVWVCVHIKIVYMRAKKTRAWLKPLSSL
jgi:hypothetical protein